MGLEIDRIEMLTSLHNVTDEQLKYLATTVDEANIVAGYSLVDLFAGDGIAASTIARYTLNKGIAPGKIILVDNHKQILDKAVPKFSDLLPTEFLVVDLFKKFVNIEQNSIDIFVIKMGLHELPFTRQFDLLQEIYNSLRPGGQLVIWENNVPKIGSTDRFGFNKIVAEKDKLAGLSVMAKQRYFTSGTELMAILVAANFIGIEIRHEWTRIWNSHDRLYTEFDGDLSRLEQLNNSIDRLIPQGLREDAGYQITNGGLGRAFNLSTQIISVRK